MTASARHRLRRLNARLGVFLALLASALIGALPALHTAIGCVGACEHAALVAHARQGDASSDQDGAGCSDVHSCADTDGHHDHDDHEQPTNREPAREPPPGSDRPNRPCAICVHVLTGHGGGLATRSPGLILLAPRTIETLGDALLFRLDADHADPRSSRGPPTRTA